MIGSLYPATLRRNVIISRISSKVRCHIDFCVLICGENTLNLGQTWLPGFSAMHRYTTFVMASKKLESGARLSCQFCKRMYQVAMTRVPTLPRIPLDISNYL